MKTNIQELIELYDEALRRFGKRAVRVEEESREINVCTRLIETAKENISEYNDLNEEVERKQEEIDDLSPQLEQKDKEIDDLRRQLLEAKNQHLESEKHHLEAEACAKPMEIHNHFESGSSSQVFNEKVTGKFIKNKDKKEKKKRWKKIARRML